MPDAWTSDLAYEPYIGRWSRLVAPLFLAWLTPRPSAVWCDLGCGTGALSQAILAGEDPDRVLGIDPSREYLAAARRGGVADVAVGSAMAIPAGTGMFDRVVSALMVNFVPRPAAALAEMLRVTRRRGCVAAYVWDYAEGMELIRTFWDAAVALDPAAADLDEARRFPICRPGPLRSLFETAGLSDVEAAPIEVVGVFADFDELWQPFLGGQGPAPGYVASLSPPRRDALRDHLRATLPEGAISLRARAWAVRGRVR